MRWMAMVLGLFALCCPAMGRAASFDCEKARSSIEKAICADDYLSDLDSKLAGYYRLVALQPGLLDDQRRWNKENGAQCQAENAEAMTRCLVRRYKKRRLFLLDIVQRAALEKAPEINAGPYTYKKVTVKFSDANTMTYVILTKPSEIADAFNAIVAPDRREFLDRCDEQSFETSLELATNGMVNISTRSWAFCQGAPHGYGYDTGHTIVMKPKPHLIAAEDLFRPGSAWQQRVAEICLDHVKIEVPLDPEQEREVRELAVDPRNWIVTPDRLVIELGSLNGAALPSVDAEIAWKRLDDLLLDDLPFSP